MDKKLIKEYGEEILCYRIRTKRQKTRAQYEDLDKKLIQLHREERALSRIKWNLGWEPLTPPVQKGWVRNFVLRDDVARSKDAAFFHEILWKINTSEWSYRKDFLKKKRKLGRKIFIVRDQSLKKPWHTEFMKMAFNDKEKMFFDAEYHYYNNTRRVEVRYAFNEPWRFVLRVRPNIIDKVKRRDELIEARLEEIRSYLQKNDLWRRLTKIVYGGDYYRYKGWIDEWYKHEYKNKSISQIIDLIKE